MIRSHFGSSYVGSSVVVCNVICLCMVVNEYGKESLQVIIGFRQVNVTPCLVYWIAKCKSLPHTCGVLMVRVVMFIPSLGHHFMNGRELVTL